MIPGRLFDHLVDLTAIRDMELLESSLLRTIHQYLRPLHVSIIKVDASNNLISEILYTGEKCELDTSGKELSGNIQEMISHMRSANLCEHMQSTSSGFLTLYEIKKTHSQLILLRILNLESVTKENHHLILGLMEIFRNYVQLLMENNTDALTGLLNRKSFDATIDKIYELSIGTDELHQNERRESHDCNYWMVMIDIDHFKSINDKYGHLYGDDVLILLASIIRDCFRREDLIFRFGGEEFVLIIDCKDLQSARLALEKLLNSVSSHLFPKVGRVTISAGAIQIDRRTSPSTLLDHADQALYYSKQHGRNRATFYEDMLEKGIVSEQQLESGEVDFF